MGIVKVPVPKTFTTGPPEIVPKVADPMTAACAGHPRNFRVTTTAIRIRDFPPAEAPNKEPRTT